jgi:NADH-quinone oxidoreductase subunit N
MTAVVSVSDFAALLPELFLVTISLCLVVFGAVGGDRIARGVCVLAILSALLCVGLLWTGAGGTQTAFGGAFVIDPFGLFLKSLVMAGLAVSVALSVGWWTREGALRVEYPVLVLLAGTGMMLMISANSLLGMYVAIELQSLALYVLAAFRRECVRSGEAGLKYFVLGALSSGMLLFGISLVYGFSGQIGFDAIAQALALEDRFPPGVMVGVVFILAALAFKISAVPLHMWTPDVYEGAPAPVTALFALVPKVAALALLARLLSGPFAQGVEGWSPILVFLSAASMGVGAFAAIRQENIKRLMAYSAIGNMGYALIGLVVGGPDGVSGMLVYLAIYMAMTAGAFAVILSMRRDGVAVESISDLAGLSRTAPVRAWAMAAVMFSMAGIPPLAGFFGKFLIFNAAVAQGYYVLAVFGVLTSVVAAWYYLRIIKVMFFDSPVGALDSERDSLRGAVLALSVAFVLGFVVLPAPLMEVARAAAEDLFASG